MNFLSHVTLKFNGWPCKNNRAPHLCYIKLCASFQSHGWIQTGVTVQKVSIPVKIWHMFCPVWPWNLMMTLKNKWTPIPYYAKLCASFQSHHRIQIGVTVWKHSIRDKSAIFCPMSPWNLTNNLEKQWKTSFMLLQALDVIYTPSMNSKWSYSPIMPNLGWWFFVPCHLEIWQMTLRNNSAPLLCYLKLCIWFCSHW